MEGTGCLGGGTFCVLCSFMHPWFELRHNVSVCMKVSCMYELVIFLDLPSSGMPVTHW